MPNIHEYTAEVGLRPSEIGPDTWMQAGRHIGAFYNSMGASIGGGLQTIGRTVSKFQDAQEQAQTQAEISQGAASMANWTDSAITQWNSVAGAMAQGKTGAGGTSWGALGQGKPAASTDTPMSSISRFFGIEGE
jgi:hypothetical protein